ncbi:PREDICTED: interleukin-12 receptor subunit beta-1 [Buceros rhinoceros silvestris]|uniref:interleukin-12 receptor subunit beta-1 n=1 Tax=Buceros rhinoceros silvestris TaxID=175836 RepID=UPI000528AF09|nr:PREDICTED: interleukin-12 receptor subunit beta-1 [Buceros rhinoceros silvestris]
MPACRCTEEDAVVAEEDTVVLGREVTEHNLTLSGAEYEILVTAANAAGPGPPWQLRVPAEQPADLGFKDISVAGGIVTAWWEAPTSGSVYCFEQQPLLGDPKQGVCIQRAFPDKSIHVETGALEAPACFRLAVHGWAPERGWSTFALQHHYAGNASLAVPFHINASAGDAAAIVLQWSLSPRAACPGMLVKYLICYAAEGDNVTCPQGAVWKSYLKYLGILLGLPAMAAIYQLSKKSPGFLEPSERFSPAELLIPEPNPSTEKTDTGTRPPITPQPGPAAEEPVGVCPPGCEKELPFTYRKQEVLSPGGLPTPGSIGCGTEGGGCPQPLVPIALLISDKPIIIRDEEGWDPSPEKTLP